VSDQRGILNYTVSHYVDGDYAEAVSYRDGAMRLDQFNAIRYALGATSNVTDMPARFAEQVTMLGDWDWPRRPKLVLDLGSGRGELAAGLAALTIPYLAVDPSPGGSFLTPQTIVDWSGWRPHFMAIPASEAVRGFAADTFMLSEAIEHLPDSELDVVLSEARRQHVLLVVTNRLEYHPIEQDGTGWNHVRDVDDAFYAVVAAGGQTVSQHGSHLVVQF
jgi:SAM-dependent methyltransferase